MFATSSPARSQCLCWHLQLESCLLYTSTTIITTNYADLPAAAGGLSGPERAAREDTLGDRIGDRMRSRLAEMCVRIEMTGEDFRQTVKRARFG